jgi:hypothetical protein
LTCNSLTPVPSPATDIDNNPQIFVAGEGSIGERGLRPLSNSFPLSNKTIFYLAFSYLFERGIKGVSLGYITSKTK